jgi:hypothetical protein
MEHELEAIKVSGLGEEAASEGVKRNEKKHLKAG